MRRFFLAGSLLLGLWWLLLPTKVSADPGPATTFTVTPAIIDKVVAPGDNLDFTIQLQNQSPTAQALSVYAKNFAASNLEGEITFGDENITSYAAASWLTITQPSLALSPNETQQIPFHLAVPSNAEPGGHYASVLFEQVLQNAPSQHSQVQVASRLAVLLFLTVKGHIVEAGQVLGATPGSSCSAVVCGLSAPKFLDKGPVPFSFIFNNTGNIHVRPKGTIKIYQNNQLVDTLPVDDRAVLPNSQRKFDLTWNRIVLLGSYTAKLHLVYGSHNYTIDASTTFYAFPWQWVLGASLFILAILGIFIARKYYSIQHLRRKLKA